MKRRISATLVFCFLIFAATGAQAEILTFLFTDPVSDFSGSIDITRLDFVFDNVTGDYKINIFAASANPFSEAFRININLFNRPAWCGRT